MLHLSRVLGPRLTGSSLSDRPRSARRVCGVWRLGLVVLLLGCASAAPPPEAPDEAPAGTEGTAAAGDTAPDEPSPPAPTEPAPINSAGEPASSATTSPARDTRGKQEIQQVMANNRDKVRACYDAALAKNPGIAGDLVVDFTIDPRGDVKQAEVNWSQSEIHVPELDSCAADAVRSLKFPASSRGLESKVSFPFNFNPPRQSPPGQGSPTQAEPR